MSDQGSTGGDIWVVPRPAASPKNLTPEPTSTPAYFGWINDKTLISPSMPAEARASWFITSTPAKDDPDRDRDLSRVDRLGNLGDERLGCAQRRYRPRSQLVRAPPEVWAGPMADLKQITHLNDSAKAALGQD